MAGLDVELKIRNFRCFGDAPVSYRIRDGFTALVGLNNGGKSSLLRLLYEMRHLFQGMGSQGWSTVARGHRDGWFSPLIQSGERVNRANSDSPVTIDVIVHDGPHGRFHFQGRQLVARYEYVQNTPITGSLLMDDQAIDAQQSAFSAVNPEPLIAASAILGNTLYVGPFRNAVSQANQQAYFDLQIGTGFVSTFAQYKSGPNPKENEAVVRLISELKQIFGYESLDINPTPDGSTLQITTDGYSYRLSELGAGLAHFVVVLVNVLVRRPQILLIDEPE